MAELDKQSEAEQNLNSLKSSSSSKGNNERKSVTSSHKSTKSKLIKLAPALDKKWILMKWCINDVWEIHRLNINSNGQNLFLLIPWMKVNELLKRISFRVRKRFLRSELWKLIISHLYIGSVNSLIVTKRHACVSPNQFLLSLEKKKKKFKKSFKGLKKMFT